MAAGAFNTRSTTEPLAQALASQFTVLNYDRRGRGDSGDTAPYAVGREIEDLAALIGPLPCCVYPCTVLAATRSRARSRCSCARASARFAATFEPVHSGRGCDVA